MTDRKQRKPTRLKSYNYSENGAYFVTMCTKDRQCILSKIVGSDALDAPMVCLTDYGKIVDAEICKMNSIYENIQVIRYVIMPNHVHLLAVIKHCDGASRASLPTKSVLSTYVGTLKRFCNKRCGKQLWQTSFYDHIIRNDEDMYNHLQYIDENPKKWLIGKDEYYQ